MKRIIVSLIVVLSLSASCKKEITKNYVTQTDTVTVLTSSQYKYVVYTGITYYKKGVYSSSQPYDSWTRADTVSVTYSYANNMIQFYGDSLFRAAFTNNSKSFDYSFDYNRQRVTFTLSGDSLYCYQGYSDGKNYWFYSFAGKK